MDYIYCWARGWLTISSFFNIKIYLLFFIEMMISLLIIWSKILHIIKNAISHQENNSLTNILHINLFSLTLSFCTLLHSRTNPKIALTILTIIRSLVNKIYQTSWYTVNNRFNLWWLSSWYDKWIAIKWWVTLLDCK